MSDELETLIRSAETSLRPLLTAAYTAGMKAGREEAAQQLAAEIAQLVEHISRGFDKPTDSLTITDADKAQAQNFARGASTDRAAPGSVKPAILKLIQGSNGMTLREIEQETGFKYNSVRGTLWQLQQEGEIEKVGDEFRAVPQKDEPAGTPSQDAPTGSEPSIFD